jgi:hypothetical protein
VEIRKSFAEGVWQNAMKSPALLSGIAVSVVTESTGPRAAINVADGERQSAILKAEGEKNRLPSSGGR